MKILLSTLFTTLALLIATPSFANDAEMATTSAEENIVLYVDINQDGAEKLADLLNGVGLKKAEAIIAYRTKHGPFKSVDDLLNVPGIGVVTLEKNRAAIIIGEGV